MSYHNPDKWVIIKITGKDPHYRVFCSWYGGYGGSDSWRMNSGITKLIEEDDYYLFIGSRMKLMLRMLLTKMIGLLHELDQNCRYGTWKRRLEYSRLF
jgi:hypothetical protein